MNKLSSKELRDKWLKFYEARGHVNIGAVSLIGDGSTGVMFNVAGMQPLMPYLLGKKHEKGTRLCNVQGCVRTVDIDSVGDASHFTFFEMMGNWSLGDYFKKEKTQWTFDFLTKVLGFDPNKICSTVFEGDSVVPRDNETVELLKQVGIKEENIYYLPKKDNWWELEGTVGTPCGPDNEWYYPNGKDKCSDKCDLTCDCGRYVEVGNDVYMQYEKLENNNYRPLTSKNVDTGFGLDRLLMFINGFNDGYKTDLFAGAIKKLEEFSGVSYLDNEKQTKAMRVIADHIRTAVMLIGDRNGIVPSNVGAGYILRRLIRRAIRYSRDLNLESMTLLEVAKVFINDVYGEAYPQLIEKESYILEELAKEIEKFEATLVAGLKEFEKAISGIVRKNEFMKSKDASFVADNVFSGKIAFRLYDTFGFPLEMTEELAKEQGYIVDTEAYKQAFNEHQENSRTAQVGEFKGGLIDHSEISTRYHTAVHLLQAGLRKLVNGDIHQKGQNITHERARFDFNLDRPMTDEEIKAVEDFVNDAINKKIDVKMEEMILEEANKLGALGEFNDKYGNVVKVYSIGDISCEKCNGPHVKNTAEIGKFKIVKEQSSSQGVRRIKAILQ